MNTEHDHTWTREQMAAALTGGLSADEQSRIEAHLAACESCAAEVAEMKVREADLADLFADAKPEAGFEDRMIRALRETSSPRRNWVHPLVRRAATGVAAAILLGSAGYVVTAAYSGGAPNSLADAVNRVKDASNLKQIGLALTLYSNENRGALSSARNPIFAEPSSNAEKDNYGITPAQPTDESNVTRLGKNLRYSYQDPQLNTGADGGGFKLNNSISSEFAVGRDISPGTSNGRGGETRSRGTTAWKETDGKNAQYGDGHVDYFENPFPAIQPDNLAKGKDHDGDKAGVPIRGEAKQQVGWDFSRPTPLVDAPFKPTQLGTEVKTTGGVAGASSSNGTDPALQPTANLDTPAVQQAKKPEEAGKLVEGLLQRQAEAANVARGEITYTIDTELRNVQDALSKRDVKAANEALGRAKAAQNINPHRFTEAEAKAFEGLIAKAQTAVQSASGGQSPATAAQAPASTRKVIRTGTMEFEVDRFDSALAMITKLTQESDGYVGTTDSEKLPNGKVKGTVTVRVPPERLDALVMQLRGIGDLRSQKMDAQDVTKQYTDLEGELRAARAMEERLLDIIKTGKGEIKDLLAAEKELSVWRGKIEKIVGEMKYYDNLVSLTTLTVTLFERDIRTAALAKETETVNAGIEAEDVEAARAAALKAIEDAKGRVIQSELKRHDAGQFSAVVIADVSPDQAGALVDRIKQLGKVARFEVQRKQTTPDGTTQPAPGARLERADTRVNLSLYNLANVEPRQTTTFDLAAADVESAYKAIAARVAKAGGRVVASNLARPQAEQVIGKIQFQVKAADADGVLTDVRGLGEVMHLTVNENADTNNVTAAKQGFVVQVLPIAQIPVRESTNIQIAATDVPAAYNALRDLVRGSAATVRVSTAQLVEAQQQNVNAILDFEIMRSELPAIDDAIKKLGDITQRTNGRSGDTENTIDSKVRVQVSFVDADQIPPRETTSLGIETSDPDKAVADVQTLAQSLGGRVLQSNLTQERGGQTIGKLIVDVPLAKSVELITRAKTAGTVRLVQSQKNAAATDGSLARARVDMTYTTSAAIVGADQGVWASIRNGLTTSMKGLMVSLQLIIVGLCFVGPWVLVIALIWKFLRRRKRQTPESPGAPVVA
jgi:glycine cleavage system regulatory protein